MLFSRPILQEAQAASINANRTQYNILGKQKDICQVVLKPCVPIYVKRDNLILLQANNSLKGKTDSAEAGNVSLSTKWLFPFASFRYSPLRFFFDPPIYHRLVTDSTDKTTCLIGSNNGTSLCHVNLNGSKDWYLKPSISNRIVSMEETSTLHINPSVKFSKIGMKFIKADGRGSLAIQNDVASSGSSNGGIYSIVLEENENCIIKRDNLLGISGDSFLELSENLVNFEFKETVANKKSDEAVPAKNPSRFSKLLNAIGFKRESAKTPVLKNYKESGVIVVEDEAAKPSPKVAEVPDFSLSLFFKMTYNGLKIVYQKMHYLLYQISTGNLGFALLNVFGTNSNHSPFSRMFQNKFVKVSGPRTLLVQSNPSNYASSSPKKELHNVSVNDSTKKNDDVDLTKILNFNNSGYNDTASNIKQLQKLNDSKYDSMKYLSQAYVDVKNGKVVFESVEKF